MNIPSGVDITVVGSGFAGSLIALGLRQIGYRVALIEKKSHPRFAIGESSTPVADLILRDLAENFHMPWLHDLSRYGSWQKTHPEISCGLKRGFSYFKHRPGRSFRTGQRHENELLVAASSNREQSDTNWFRQDLDAFLVKKAQQSGVIYCDQTEITRLVRNGLHWEMGLLSNGMAKGVKTRWLVDASGSNSILSELGVKMHSTGFRTHTSALFSHFKGVGTWQKRLRDLGISTADYPYNPDNSALHHLLEEGWCWMLRFNNGITSAGLVVNHAAPGVSPPGKGDWGQIIQKYPSLKEQFREARFAERPGELIQSGRLQRRAVRAAGDGWVALPHTAGFVDPLHSTGIAHSLSGVERILHAFEIGSNDPARQALLLGAYEKDVFQELDFIDLLVAGCYRAMPHFETFHIFSSLYFIAAIHYEQKRLAGQFDLQKHQFLSADHADIVALSQSFYAALPRILRNGVSISEIRAFRNAVEEAIAPYNTAGLLQSEIPHIYYHTTADF